jgi:hypothetical protein
MKYRPPSDVLVKVENQPDSDDTLRLTFQDGHVKEITVYGYNVEEKNDNRRVIGTLLELAIKIGSQVEIPKLFKRDTPERPDEPEGGVVSEMPTVPEDRGGRAVQALPSPSERPQDLAAAAIEKNLDRQRWPASYED